MNLQAAIDAVREESAERGTAELMTRRRVLASIERSPSRRLHAVVAAVIASMFGASAFAWYARAPEREPAPAIVHEAVAVAILEPSATPERVTVHVETQAEAPSVVAVEPAVPPQPKPTTSEPAAISKPSAASEPAVAQPDRDPELALYATAHHLHFQQHDMTAAIAAWDRYLAVAPAGKLAPEARFNRLVALVRVQRWADAARALDAFEDTTFRPADVAKLRALISSHRPQ